MRTEDGQRGGTQSLEECAVNGTGQARPVVKHQHQQRGEIEQPQWRQMPFVEQFVELAGRVQRERNRTDGMPPN